MLEDGILTFSFLQHAIQLVSVPNTGQLAYVQTRLRTNSPTTCHLAYVGEFTQAMYAFYNFILSFCEQRPKYFFVWIGSALDERTRNKLYGVKCWVHILNRSCG